MRNTVVSAAPAHRGMLRRFFLLSLAGFYAAATFVVLFCPAPAAAQPAAQENALVTLNPLMSYRQHVRQLNRACGATPHTDVCIRRRSRLRKAHEQLRAICGRNPDDGRCGMLVKPQRRPGWRDRDYCFQHPHERKCVVRRERAKRREKMRRKFCAKNPDAHRCIPPSQRGTKGFRSVYEYCRAMPSRMVCQALERKRGEKAAKKKRRTNRF